jgi:hypothetical protein
LRSHAAIVAGIKDGAGERCADLDFDCGNDGSRLSSG